MSAVPPDRPLEPERRRSWVYPVVIVAMLALMGSGAWWIWGRGGFDPNRAQPVQAEGQLARDAAQLNNARLDLERYRQLLAQDSIAAQQNVQRELLDDTVEAFRKSLQVTQNRYKAGVAARVDVVQTETQLKSTEAQALDLRVAPAKFDARIPQIPPGLPSTRGHLHYTCADPAVSAGTETR